MPIQVACVCGKKLSVKDELAGKRVKCPACHQVVRIPEVVSPEAAAETDWLGRDAESQAAKSAVRAAKGDLNLSALVSTRASNVRTGVSCYFFGFLVIFFTACYAACAPTLHQGDVMTLLRVIRGVNGVCLLAEIVIAVGLVLCVTAPERMRGRGILYVAVLSSVLELMISAATVWNPLFSLRVGHWLPHLVLLTSHASFFLFLRWLGEFLGRSEITNRATRVLVLMAIGAAIWLGVFRAQAPALLGRMGQLDRVAVMLLLSLIVGIVALIGLFSVIRLLSICREVLRPEGHPAVDSNSKPAALATDRTSKWLTRPDTLKLAIGSGLVSLTFWGWLLLVKPAPALAPFPIGAPRGPSVVTSPGKKTLLLSGHQGIVRNVAFNPDWSRLATAGYDKTIKIWDAATAKTLHTLTGHTGEVRHVAFSPDGKWLASASADKSVKVWNADNGQEARTLTGHAGSVVSVAFSPDGQRLASASDDKAVKVWKVTTGEEQLSLAGHAEPVSHVVFSPDGTRLASAGGLGVSGVKIWDSMSGQELFTLKGHTTLLSSMAFRPDGKQLATASYDMTVKLWDTTSGQETHALVGHVGAVMGMAYRPDGKRLASTGVGMMVKEWDSASGQLCRTFPTTNPGGLTFSADGKRLASATVFGAVEICDIPPDQQPHSHSGHTGAVTSVAFSPDGQRIASASWDQTVRVWNSITGQEAHTLKGHAGPVGSVAFSSDGTSLVSVGQPVIRPGAVKVWNAHSGEATRTLELPVTGIVAISEDGTRIASPSLSLIGNVPAGSQLALKVWDSTSGKELLALKGHSGPISSIALSRDGQWMVSMAGAFGKPGEIKVWDVSSGQETLQLGKQTSGVTRVAISPDGKRLASSNPDRTVNVWDTSNGQELLTLKGHAYPTNSMAFSPDGKWLASGSGIVPTLPGEMKLWDVATGQEKLTLKGHKFGVNGLTFSPDGKRLASASADETVRVWDTATGRELLVLGVPVQ